MTNLPYMIKSHEACDANKRGGDYCNAIDSSLGLITITDISDSPLQVSPTGGCQYGWLLRLP